MKKSGIYKITNIVNNKFYIGSSVDIKTRWKTHVGQLTKGKHVNLYLQRSWDKHGKDSFMFEIVELMENVSNILEVEQFYLDSLIPFKENGYNICENASGGDNNANHPNKKEIYKKISATKKKNYQNMTPQEKSRFLEKMRGKNHPNYGNKYDYDRKQKIKKRVSDYWDAHPELKEKLSTKQMGGNNSFYGKKHSNITKQIWKTQRCKPIVIDGTSYGSTKEASEILNISTKKIHYRLKTNKYLNYTYAKK